MRCTGSLFTLNAIFHSSVDGHLGSPHFLATMYKTAMNISIDVFPWIYVLALLGKYLAVGFLSPMVSVGLTS